MERKKRRRSNPNQASDVLQALLEKGNGALATQFQRYRLKVQWPQVVGATLGQACYPCGYYRGKLFVCAKNSAWLNQLYYARKEIMAKVNAYLEQTWVTDIKFTLNPKDVPIGAIQTGDPLGVNEPASPSEGGEPQRGR